MIKVKFSSKIPSVSLVQSIIDTFPELKGDKSKVTVIAPSPENPEESLLEINALLPRAKVIEVVRSQFKKLSSGEAVKGAFDDDKALYELAMKIPAGKEVIQAGLAILGAIDDSINEAGNDILVSVGNLENAHLEVKKSLGEVKSDSREFVIQELAVIRKEIQANETGFDKKLQAHSKRIAGLKSKFDAMLTLFREAGEKEEDENGGE